MPSALLAEVDENRTRQAGCARLAGFEDHAGHQAGFTSLLPSARSLRASGILVILSIQAIHVNTEADYDSACHGSRAF